MSVEEKRWWAYGAIALMVPAVYFAVMLPRALAGPVDGIAYQVPLLVAGAAGALLGVVSTILLRISSRMASPTGAPLHDQRDRDIHRLGEYVAGFVLAGSMGVPFALAWLGAEDFWIANTMCLAFSLWALVGSAVKLAIYRRGF